MNDDNAIILSPEVQKLKDECSLLAEELAGLFAERDNLLNTIAPNIMAKYATTIGVKEYEALALDVEVRKLKATIEKIQAVENQRKKANLEQIEAAVEDELTEWQAKVDKMLGEIKASEERLKNLLTDEDSKELLKLYRSLAKKLHPDVNPNLTEEQKAIWIKVQQAYECGDLQELRALQLLVDDMPEEVITASSLDMLTTRRSKLKAQVTDLITKLAELRHQPPLNLEARLGDQVWIDDQIADCEARIKDFSEKRETLENWIAVWKSKKNDRSK